MKFRASGFACIGLLCGLLAACGGGGGGGGGNPTQPQQPQAQAIAFTQVGPLSAAIGSTTDERR